MAHTIMSPFTAMLAAGSFMAGAAVASVISTQAPEKVEQLNLLGMTRTQVLDAREHKLLDREKEVEAYARQLVERERQSLEASVGATEHNRDYLAVKKAKLGHHS